MITIKNASQIAKMREAGALLHEVLEQLKGKIEPGITTKELDRYAEKLIRGYGAVPSFLNYEGYPASICRWILRWCMAFRMNPRCCARARLSRLIRA